MQQGELLWTAHHNYITSTARSISRSYAKVEEEDVTQEIWVFLWKKEPAFLEQERSDEYIRRSILNVARNYAAKMRDTALRETDTFYYTLEEVKDLLPHFFGLYESWALAPVPDGAATMTRNDNVEMMCDLSLAMDKLSAAQREILVRKYGDGEELSEPKDRQQASRAVIRLWKTLNTETDKRAKAHEGPGNRKVISNSKSVYDTKSAVDD
ncbi:sigma factor [Nocardioides sp. SOB72]|uniref:Sigma factor n=2 Tax=Nocardioides abyssi TaxID=3058370 RepID=A0ABT8EXR4_9ACTN|nr:sigma factor [Nocardioides abyssi]MDN4162955.1 sigma factor [Nocardioides abyssi]